MKEFRMSGIGLRKLLGTCLLVLCTLATPVRGADAPGQELLVFAAASLTNALDEIGAAYMQQTRQRVKFSYAASSALARQLEAGARADVFFSADLEWMNYLQARKLIDRSTRRNVVSNRLVLVAPADSKIELKIAPGFALAAALGDSRLATGDPDTVPVGRYARSALTSLGVWDDVADRLVRADNVRSALAFIARGETPLGIVYETDARIEKRVRIVDFFPADSHSPILYPVAVTAEARPAARQFVDFLQSAAAQQAFEKYGFQSGVAFAHVLR
jgi:molybdate transport system substrate-binding protein